MRRGWTPDGEQQKYLAEGTARNRDTVQALRDQGYDIVITPELPPAAAAKAVIDEDASHLLLPDRYDTDETEQLVDTLTEYERDDVTLLQQYDTDDGREYRELPTDWQDIDGVGPDVEQVLDDTNLVPWNIDEQELNRELVKAYGVATKNMLAGTIKRENPYLFNAADDADAASDRPWPETER